MAKKLIDEKKDLKKADKNSHLIDHNYESDKDKANEKFVYLKKLIESIKEDEIMPLAAGVAYYLISSIVPFLIVFISIATKIVSDNLEALSDLIKIIPEQALLVLDPIIENILETSSAPLLSISVIAALISSSAGSKNLIRAMDIAFNVPRENQSFIKKTIKSVAMTMLLIMMIFVTLIFVTFGGALENLLVKTFGTRIIVLSSLIRYLIPILSMVIGFSLMFKFGPNFKASGRKKIRWSSAFIGGLLTAFGWTLISFGYSFYVTNMSNMSLTYGPLVGIFVLFVWLYISATIVIAVSEIVSVYDQVRNGVLYSS